MQQTLRITEIFYSLQGETRTAGLPTVFVRLTGCPLRCHYCDTAYAFSGGDVVSLDAILERVATYKPRYEVLFSPSHYQVSARELADWIVADNLPVRLQLQLHKILWNDEPGH